MSLRKTILRELHRIHQHQGPEVFTSPRALPGFDADDMRYTRAVNSLLQERLIRGTKGTDGGMAIALNGGRLSEVRKLVRPWYASPALWAVAALVVVGLGVIGLVI